MIIFATHHDESTSESIKLAESIIEEQDKILLRDEAVRSRLLSLLATYKQEQLMIFSHGKANYCLGNDNIPAFTTKYLALYPESLDFMGVSTTLRNIWAKLEIWLMNQKYVHAEAIERPLW